MGRSREPDSAAEAKLRDWATVGRDDTVLEAGAADLGIARILQITGLATTTIERILNKPPSRHRHCH
ncbi:MAG: hypothetical protein ACTHPS_08110 [Streptosporangiaceae bacterium]